MPFAEGSSPLARGKWFRLGGMRVLRRFIPTRAGKISIKTGAAAAAPGSSPLARGKFHLGLHRSDPSRFIPTRAGKIQVGYY